MNSSFRAAGKLAMAASCLALAAVAAAALSATPAVAAKKRAVVANAYAQSPPPRGVTVRGPNVSYMSGPHTRVFITKRSWLDAGTEVLPGERHYLDYALPPGNSAGINNLAGPAAPAGWQNPNWPLLGRWEAPQRDW
jgi:hypothetical protein